MSNLHSKAISDEKLASLRKHYTGVVQGLAIYHEDTRGFWARLFFSSEKKKEPRSEVRYEYYDRFVRIRRTGPNAFQMTYTRFRSQPYERAEEGLTIDDVTDSLLINLHIKPLESGYAESHIKFQCPNCATISDVYKYSEDGIERSL
jgi:hypothetical protein